MLLSLFDSWPSNADLSLSQLSAKLVTLFFLVSCKSILDVRALVDARSFPADGVTYIYPDARILGLGRFLTRLSLRLQRCAQWPVYEYMKFALSRIGHHLLLICFYPFVLPLLVTSTTMAHWVK
ncbi:Hypothetical predicted protein [Pelobates cultripes]|uniref:Uncharacterized protein n=1 Tax=Pelobates cultripes TaxID=61616 RepID=A0AAD1S2W1_PELCU|nr:Hypothetical predicted protein [Pelobates cultripes]